jgi:hypothetical protein
LPAASAVVAAAGLLLATTPGPSVVLTMKDPSITESSGLAVSGAHPHVLWTHNDGGSVAQVAAINRHGATVAWVTLAGIDPYDPEALAPGTDASGRPALFLGDIGDNDRRRPDVSVFRFSEPSRLVDQTVTATWYRFTYPDGPHDAEALLVGPTGRIMIATKALSGGALYRAPRHLVTRDQGTNRLTRITGVPSLVTDGAYLPDGRFVLRSYTAVYVYDRPGHEVDEAELPPQPQGESVAADGNRLLIGSEGLHSQVLAVPVPTADTLSPPPSTHAATHPPSATPAPAAASSSGPSGWALAGLGALVVLVGGAALAAATRRRTRP